MAPSEAGVERFADVLQELDFERVADDRPVVGVETVVALEDGAPRKRTSCLLPR